MAVKSVRLLCLVAVLVSAVGITAGAQSFKVQCPTTTITHPLATNDAEPAYLGPTYANKDVYGSAMAYNNGAIKCQQISGGDGFATMGDGTQTYLFSFGPLSGIADVAAGRPGTQPPSIFNSPYPPGPPYLQPGDPATTDSGAVGSFTYNGAIGQVPDLDCIADNNKALAQVPAAPLPCPNVPMTGPFMGIDGHVDSRQIMNIGVMNGNIPAPLMAIDEDDEFFLTLSNVGQVMRPDLFEQHTVHFHGYPNASAFYDGVPDASVAINIGASFTYYYLAPDAGTYFWHCHITPPEHLQMGMVGQIYVRPRQNRLPVDTDLYTGLTWQQGDLRTKCDVNADVLCSNSLPAINNGAKHAAGAQYAYNDGDGSTRYDVEYPLQIHGFDPNFHFVGMTFNPEGFADMKDKYFLLNGRSYPDTVTAGPITTQSTDGSNHYAQPLDSIINIPAGKRALLRISDLDVTEYQTLASLGIPMTVVGWNAKLLRDQAGNNLAYNTNSVTLAGGESCDVILDTTSVPKGIYYLYTSNLDHLSNDAENFGGLMTEVHVN